MLIHINLDFDFTFCPNYWLRAHIIIKWSVELRKAAALSENPFNVKSEKLEQVKAQPVYNNNFHLSINKSQTWVDGVLF